MHTSLKVPGHMRITSMSALSFSITCVLGFAADVNVRTRASGDTPAPAPGAAKDSDEENGTFNMLTYSIVDMYLILKLKVRLPGLR